MYNDLPNLKQVFYPPQQNNFVDILIPKRYDVADYLEKIKIDTTPLNDADSALLKQCDRMLGAETSDTIYNWALCLKEKKNLLSIYYATELIAYIEKYLLDCKFCDYLKYNCVDVLDKFRQVSDQMLGIIRLNIYLAAGEEVNFLELLLDKFVTQPELQYLVDRCEISSQPFKTPEKNNAFPNLLIYPVNMQSVGHLTPVIRDILKKIKISEINPEFSYTLMPGITITQGFRLYKRYLSLVGIIDEIYHVDTGYAFIKSNTKEMSDLLGDICTVT